MKPLGKYPVTIDGKVVDSDAGFMYEVLELKDPLELVSPVMMTQEMIAHAYRGEDLKLEEKIEKGRLKKLYTITPRGKNFFQNWLLKEPVPLKIRSEALLKIFFFSYVSEETRHKHIDSTMEQLNRQAKELKVIQQTVNSIEGIDKYQMLCLKYGIEFIQFTQGILKDLKTEITRSMKPSGNLLTGIRVTE